jgi:hypothetical protein
MFGFLGRILFRGTLTVSGARRLTWMVDNPLSTASLFHYPFLAEGRTLEASIWIEVETLCT